MDHIREKIIAGDYNTKKPWPSRRDPNKLALVDEYRQDQAALERLLKSDLEAVCGVSGKPKAITLWEIAWDLGHACGLGEVANYYERLVDLIK